jgi:hypothetical protein
MSYCTSILLPPKWLSFVKKWKFLGVDSTNVHQLSPGIVFPTSKTLITLLHLRSEFSRWDTNISKHRLYAPNQFHSMNRPPVAYHIEKKSQQAGISSNSLEAYRARILVFVPKELSLDDFAFPSDCSLLPLHMPPCLRQCSKFKQKKGNKLRTGDEKKRPPGWLEARDGPAPPRGRSDQEMTAVLHGRAAAARSHHPPGTLEEKTWAPGLHITSGLGLLSLFCRGNDSAGPRPRKWQQRWLPDPSLLRLPLRRNS